MACKQVVANIKFVLLLGGDFVDFIRNCGEDERQSRVHDAGMAIDVWNKFLAGFFHEVEGGLLIPNLLLKENVQTSVFEIEILESRNMQSLIELGEVFEVRNCLPEVGRNLRTQRNVWGMSKNWFLNCHLKIDGGNNSPNTIKISPEGILCIRN